MAIISNFPAGGGGSKSLNNAVITLATSSFVYDGTEKNQQIQSVVLNGTTLHEGMDYLVTGNLATEAGTHTISVLGIMDYGGVATATWSIAKAQGSVSVSPASLSIQGAGSTATAQISATGDGSLSASSGDSGVATAAISGDTLSVTCAGEGNTTVTVTLAEGDNYLGATATVAVTCSLIRVFGVSWDKSSTTVLTRTDDAVLFTDPVPAINNGSGSSPFDNYLPWSGMVKETIDDNVMVKIPKFWYKWTDDTGLLKLQIANGPLDGFHVSPAHADRSDGVGERDYVYIGRYHCNSSYKSVTGVSPLHSIARALARSKCKDVGTGYSQLDYAMLWTIRMLYLVEYADWDAQKVIGSGCSPSGSRVSMGYTDSMNYHTGTDAANRTTYGGTQYRNIEGLWDNVMDWCDGIVLYNSAAYVTNIVANYEDSTSNHIKVSNSLSTSGTEITSWEVPTASGLEWALFPNFTTTNGNFDTYIADTVNASGVVVCVGGVYSKSRNYGMFCFYSDSPSSQYSDIGTRLQYLP